MKLDFKKAIFQDRSYEVSKIILIFLVSFLFLRLSSIEHVFIKSFFITVFSFVPIIGAGLYLVVAIIFNLLEMNYLKFVLYCGLLLLIVCIERILYNVFFDKPFDYTALLYMVIGVALYLLFGKYPLLVISLLTYFLMVYNNYNRYKKNKSLIMKSKLNLTEIMQIIKQ